MTQLSEFVIGQRGRIIHVEGMDETSLRLLEMGLTPGTEIAMIGIAPLGDPIELEIRGYRLSVRKSEAARIEVEPIP